MFVIVPILFFVAFWVFGISFAVKQNKKNQAQSKSPNTYIVNKPRNYQQPENTSNLTSRTKGSSSLSKNDMFRDDRQNDWLAKQLREENKIRRRNMLDLGAMHDVNCDADLIREEHKKVHNHKRGVL